MNLHDEIPEGTRQLRVAGADSEADDYNIREMWNILVRDEQEAVEKAHIFSYGAVSSNADISQPKNYNIASKMSHLSK